jgi:hypothetical protein
MKPKKCVLRSLRLFSEFEFAENLGVAGFVLGLEVIQKATALANQLQKTEAGGVVFGVFLKVGVQGIDAVGDQGDLNFGRSGVRAGGAEGLNEVRLFGFDFCFASFAHLHVSVFLKSVFLDSGSICF